MLAASMSNWHIQISGCYSPIVRVQALPVVKLKKYILKHSSVSPINRFSSSSLSPPLSPVSTHPEPLITVKGPSSQRGVMGQDQNYQQAIAWTPALLLAALIISQLPISIIQRRKEPVLLYLVHLFILMIASESPSAPYSTLSLKLPETVPTFTVVFSQSVQNSAFL